MRKLVLAASAACLAFSAAAAVAADDPIAARQQIMENVGKSTGVGGAMAKGEMEYDPVKAMLVFRAINASIIGFPELFPEGSETGGDTEAKPEIWSDRAGFEEAAAELEQASAQLIENVPQDLDSFRAAFSDMTKKCGGCHETYRVKKN